MAGAGLTLSPSGVNWWWEQQEPPPGAAAPVWPWGPTPHCPCTSSWVKPHQEEKKQTLGCSGGICLTSVTSKGPRAVGSAGDVHTYSHQPHLRDFGSRFPPQFPSTHHSCLCPSVLWDQTQPSGVEDAKVVTSTFCFSHSRQQKPGRDSTSPVRRRQSKEVPGEHVPWGHRVSRSRCSRRVAVPSMEETLCPAARWRWGGGPAQLLHSPK